MLSTETSCYPELSDHNLNLEFKNAMISEVIFVLNNISYFDSNIRVLTSRELV